MPEKLLGNLLAMLSMAFWASGFVAVSFLLESWHPALLAPLRLFLASLVPFAWVVASGRSREFLGLPWRHIFLTGGLYLGGSGLLIVWGQGLSDATTASIITTGLPMIAALLAFFLREEGLSWQLLAGIGLAITGGVLAALATAESGPGFRGGEFVVLAAVTLFVLYSRGALKHLSGMRDMPKSATTLFAAALVVTPVSFLLLASGAVEAKYDFSPRAILLIIWMGP
ncbi:MAG: DMT family transporter, partial [Kiloniellales bacterium]|nr:DMT family transporter [Kiloniellales bacterium]